MKCTVYCTGSLKENYWKDAEAEYKKRMGRFGGWNVIELPEERLSENPSPKEIEKALQKEGENILRRLPQNAFIIALCIEGKPLSSEALAAKIAEIPNLGKSEIALIIGSSHGLAEEVKKAAQMCLSISPMTFPHQLMRVLLAEQFYRAHKINANESYHK